MIDEIRNETQYNQVMVLIEKFIKKLLTAAGLFLYQNLRRKN